MEVPPLTSHVHARKVRTSFAGSGSAAGEEIESPRGRSLSFPSSLRVATATDEQSRGLGGGMASPYSPSTILFSINHNPNFSGEAMGVTSPSASSAAGANGAAAMSASSASSPTLERANSLSPQHQQQHQQQQMQQGAQAAQQPATSTPSSHRGSLSQQLKQRQRGYVYSPIHIQQQQQAQQAPSSGEVPPPARRHSSTMQSRKLSHDLPSRLLELAASSGEDDDSSDDGSGRTSPFISGLPRRSGTGRYRSSSPRSSSGTSSGVGSMAASHQHSNSILFAGGMSNSSTAATSARTSISFNSAHGALSSSDSHSVFTPSEENTPPPVADRPSLQPTPGSASSSSSSARNRNNFNQRRRSHSAAEGATSGLDTSVDSSASSAAVAATAASAGEEATSPSSSGERRPTMGGSGSNSLASDTSATSDSTPTATGRTLSASTAASATADESEDSLTSGAYSTLLHQLLQRKSAPPEVDVFSALLSTTDNSDNASSASASSSREAQLRSLARAFRDELVLERFHRRQAQAQLQRRLEALTSIQQQQQAHLSSAEALSQNATSPAPPASSSALFASSLLSPSHLELSLDLLREEHEGLIKLFDHFKSSVLSRARAGAAHTATVERALASALAKLEEVGPDAQTKGEELALVRSELSALAEAHATQAQRLCDLGHKYVSLQQVVREMPQWESQLSAMREQLHETEARFARYREDIEGPAGVKPSLEAQVQSLAAQLASTRSELESLKLQQQSHDSVASLQSCEDAQRGREQVEELTRLLEEQKSSAAAKLAALQSQFDLVRSQNVALTQRVLDLELSSGGGGSTAATTVNHAAPAVAAPAPFSVVKALSPSSSSNSALHAQLQAAAAANAAAAGSTAGLPPAAVAGADSQRRSQSAGMALVSRPAPVAAPVSANPPSQLALALGRAASPAQAMHASGAHARAVHSPSPAAASIPPPLTSLSSPSLLEKSAPIPIVASPSHGTHRPRSSSRAGVNGPLSDLPFQWSTLPQAAVASPFGAGPHLSALPQPLIGAHASDALASPDSDVSPSIDPSAAPAGDHSSSSHGVLVPPHEQRSTRSAHWARLRSLHATLGRAAGAHAITATGAPSLHLSRSDDSSDDGDGDMMPAQFSPSPAHAHAGATHAHRRL